MIKKMLSMLFFRFSKWSLVTEEGPGGPAVFVAAPHTSNWDFILMLALAWHHQLDIRFLGKASLFGRWRGPLMRKLGGIPIDRENPQDVVSELATVMKDSPDIGLVVTPDGTRGPHQYWKSGFYRIAREAGLPITLGYVDRNTLTTGLGPTFYLTGNKRTDMEKIRSFFSDKGGFHPNRRVEPRLRDED